MKNFFSKNKALLIILLAILIAGANYLIYPVIIKNNMSMTTVCIANTTLQEGTKITEDMLDEISTSSEMLPHGIYLNKSSIVGKYVKSGYTIPENGLFYAEYLQDEQSAMGSSFGELGENKVAYTIEIDEQYNSNDTLKAGQYIELYYYAVATDAKKETSVGIMDENVRIISIEANSSSYYLTLELDTEDIGYYVIAQNGGMIVPIVSSKANSSHGEINQGAIAITRKHLTNNAGSIMAGTEN